MGYPPIPFHSYQYSHAPTYSHTPHISGKCVTTYNHLYQQHRCMNVIPLIYPIQFLPMLLNTYLYPRYKSVYSLTHTDWHILSLSPNTARNTDTMVCRPTTDCYSTSSLHTPSNVDTLLQHIPCAVQNYGTYPMKYSTTTHTSWNMELLWAVTTLCIFT